MLQNIHTVHHRLTGCGREISCQNIHCCGLARAVRTEEADDLAFFHFKADVVHGVTVAVLFGQVFNLYHIDRPFLSDDNTNFCTDFGFIMQTEKRK